MSYARHATHADAACACGRTDGARARSGRNPGDGAHVLRCPCGIATVYDLGCSKEIHARLKESAETFLSGTESHCYDHATGILWGLCPDCWSSLMIRVSFCSCCTPATVAGVCEDALARC